MYADRVNQDAVRQPRFRVQTRVICTDSTVQNYCTLVLYIVSFLYDNNVLVSYSCIIRFCVTSAVDFQYYLDSFGLDSRCSFNKLDLVWSIQK